MLTKLFTAFLLCAGLSWCAINATMEWDVRTTGADTNGGGFDSHVASPGTDFSQQNSPQQTYTDLVIGGTTTQLTSSAHAFGSTHPGNMINITGGTGCTTGWFEIISVSGSTATMDRSVGTGASTCTGNMGGSFATPGKAVAVAVNGNQIHLKTGTYTITATFTLSAPLHLRFSGYGTTHNDGGSRPTITTATNSITMFTGGGNNLLFIDNIILSNTAGTPGDCFASGQFEELYATRVKVAGAFHAAVNSNIIELVLEDTEVTGTTSSAIQGSGYAMLFKYSWIHGNTGDGVTIPNSNSDYPIYLYRSVFSDNTAAGVNYTANQKRQFHAIESVFYGNGDSGIKMGTTGSYVNNESAISTNGQAFSLENCIMYGNTGYGINQVNAVTAAWPVYASRNTAFGGNTTAARQNWSAGTNDVTLTGNPFTNAAAGDYSLNNTAGAGAACKNVGYPANFAAGLSTASSSSLGITQPASTSGGGQTGGVLSLLAITGLLVGLTIAARRRL